MPSVEKDPPATPPLELTRAVELGTTAEGVRAVAHYGDPSAEQRRLLEGCGLVDRLWVGHLELHGEDRQRFLQGLITCDISELEPGAGAYGLFTTAQGRVLAEARVAAGSESLRLELPHGSAARLAGHLRHYIVADRVEVIEPEPLRTLSLAGPVATRVAARLAPEAERLQERWSHLDATWQGVRLTLAREERLGVPALSARVPAASAAAVAAELLRPIGGTAASPAGFVAAEAVRVEAGLARFGADFGDDRFPQEVGADEALDFEKGCYLGQEVVARIHYRGKVNHRLCGLRLRGDALPAPGSPVRLAEREVGRTGTAVRSPLRAEGIALAVLHRRAEADAPVDAGGVEAVVVELPFANA